MQVMYPRCCGLDMHKKTVVACVLLTDADGTVQRFVRTFGTMTADLLALGDWLRFHAVTHVAMERKYRCPVATGVHCAGGGGGGGTHAHPGQCPARQGGAGAHNRRQGE